MIKHNHKVMKKKEIVRLPHCLPPLRLSSHPSTHPPSGKTVVAIYILNHIFNYLKNKIDKTFDAVKCAKLTSAVGNGRSGLPFPISSTQIDGRGKRPEKDVTERTGRPTQLTPRPRQAVEIAMGRRLKSRTGIGAVQLGCSQSRCDRKFKK